MNEVKSTRFVAVAIICYFLQYIAWCPVFASISYGHFSPPYYLNELMFYAFRALFELFIILAIDKMLNVWQTKLLLLLGLYNLADQFIRPFDLGSLSIAIDIGITIITYIMYKK